MKAIVMAGGEGTRLRPLTEGRPKPMVDLLGRPVLERAVEHLRSCGVTDICFTLRYLPGTVEDWFGDGEKFGVSITHRVESEPLGTAGGVRACRDFIGDEEILILSGDAVCNFDLCLLREFYEKRRAEAVIALYEHPEPTGFGLVIADEDGRVASFSEKPSWERVVTGNVNTGIYILSPEVVDMIPEETPYDFGKDLFPRLLREGRKLYAVSCQGYWCDMGTPEAYLQCCADAAAGRIGLDLHAPETEKGIWSASPLTGVLVTPPVYVGEGCVLEPGARLGPNAVLSAGSRVGRNSIVRDSVLTGARVGAGCLIEGSILSRDALVGSGARLGRGCVVGDGARVGDGAVLAPGVRIWNDRQAAPGARLSRSVTGDTPSEPARFASSSRLTGHLALSLTPEAALSLGAVLGREGRVGVALQGAQGARLISDALLCGITASGGEGVRLDAGFEAQLGGVAKLFALDAAAFVRQEGESIALTFLTGSGTAVDTALRRKLESALTGEHPRVSPDIGPVSSVSGTARAYISGVIDEVRAVSPAKGTVTLAVTGSGVENKALRCALAGLGFTVGKSRSGTASFAVSRGGFALTARDEQGRELDARHTLACAALAAMRLGISPLAAPEDLPDAAERLGVRFGVKLVTSAEERWRELWRGQRWLRDACVEAALIAAAMAKDGTELSRLAADLPPFATAERRVELKVSRARAMELLRAGGAEMASELTGGLRFTSSRGSVRVAPTFDGSALRMLAEAENAEIADELACRVESLAKEMADKDTKRENA